MSEEAEQQEPEDEEQPSPGRIILQASDDESVLEALFDEQEPPCEITHDWLRAQFEEPRWRSFLPNDEGIAKALQYYQHKQFETPVVIGKRRPAEVILKHDDVKCCVVAKLRPAHGETPFDVSTIKSELKELNCHKYFVFDEAIQELTYAIGENSEKTEFIIAEKRAAEMTIEVSEDHMQAYLTIVPPCGGELLNQPTIMAKLKAEKVVKGIRKQQLDDIFTWLTRQNQHGPTSWLIARGREPAVGEETKFTCLVPDTPHRLPKIDEDGKIDFREVGIIPHAHAGQELMYRTPPTFGEPGYDVYGKVLPGIEGEQIEFASGLRGTAISQHDENVLVATEGGMPVVIPQGVNIEPLYAVPVVNYATGNIEFDGNVKVDGDIATGMAVRCSGDLYVGGTVESANLRVGGDIIVTEGIVGIMPKYNSENPLNKQSDWRAVIECGGSVTAEFISNAKVIAAVDIVSKKAIRNSYTQAGQRMAVGASSSGQGTIIGGIAKAMIEIQTENVSAVSNTATRLEVGVKSAVRERQRTLRDQLDNRRAELSELILQEKDEETVQHLENLKQTIDKLEIQISSLNNKDEKTRPNIKVGNRIYGGSTLAIEGIPQFYRQRAVGGEFILKNAEVSRVAAEIRRK